MHQICRCCLMENPSITYNIFQDNLRAELLLFVSGITIERDDGLPEVICKQCSIRLRDAIEFRRSCEENDHVLRKRYEETNEAIEKALGINIIPTVISFTGGAHNNEQELPADMNFGGFSVRSNVSRLDEAVQLLDLYSDNLTMLDDIHPESPAVGSLIDVENDSPAESYSPLHNEDSIIINRVLPDFSTETVLESTTTTESTITDKRNFSEVTENTSDIFAVPDVRTKNTKKNKTNREADTTTQPEEEEQSSTKKKKKKKEKNEKIANTTNKKSLRSCTNCEKKFTRNYQLKQHLSLVHGIGAAAAGGRQYACTECQQNFKSLHSLNYHQKSVHSRERPHVCQHCERSFVLRTQLDSHMRMHTGELKPRTHQCTECDKSFMTKSDLKTHMRTHDQNQERPFKCKRCEKSFFTSGHLTAHELVHSGEKPYKCVLCDRSYQNVGNLNNHIYRSHFANGTPSMSSIMENMEKNATVLKSVQNNNVPAKNVIKESVASH